MRCERCLWQAWIEQKKDQLNTGWPNCDFPMAQVGTAITTNNQGQALCLSHLLDHWVDTGDMEPPPVDPNVEPAWS